MRTTDVIIIGAGQAGLAISHCLRVRGIDHVLLERGRVGERWRSARWDSLRLLTPNWQTRLPGWKYRGSDPHGFMSSDGLVALLERYARMSELPIETGVRVLRVSQRGEGYRVRTSRGDWRASNVVLATGYCDVPWRPMTAHALDPGLNQLSPTEYRTPGMLAPGGVLVVGASASGAQLADELARSGRAVALAVGRHTRVPRRYRGADIMWWLDRIGVLDEGVDDVRDVELSRDQPSLQLVGSEDRRDLDLNTLQQRGVRLCGRLVGGVGQHVRFDQNLASSARRADEKLARLLDRIDHHMDPSGMHGRVSTAERPAPIVVPESPAMLDLRREGIANVIWATGFRRDYGWLGVPVRDPRGDIVHRDGITPAPGLYVVGLRFQRTRKSSFIDGVGDDAEVIARHIAARLGMRESAAA